MFGIVVALWLWFEKNSLIKSTFCEVDLKKSWCLVKTVVEVVVLKKAVSFVWLKLWLKLWWKKKQFYVWLKLWLKLW